MPAHCELVFHIGANCQSTSRCETLMDLIIILDSSGSIGTTAFQQAKNATAELVGKLNVGPRKVHVTVINYSSTIEIPVVFKDVLVTGFTIQRMIQTIQAINLANMRSNISSRHLATVTKVNVFAVGIGDAMAGSAELKLIASHPWYVLNLQNYLQLTQVINNITMIACDLPVFVRANEKIESEVSANTYRYYQMEINDFMRDLKGQGGYIEIVTNIRQGQVSVSTSTTNTNPKLGNGKQLNSRQQAGNRYVQTYFEYIIYNLYTTTDEDLAQLDVMLQEHSVGVVSSQTGSNDRAPSPVRSESLIFGTSVTPKRHRGLYNELENGEVDDNEYSVPGVIMKNNFPLVYTLPKVDPSFETAAATPALRDFGPRCSKRIYLIKIIHDDIINTYGPDFYPSGVQFDRIGKSVYDKYPSLSNIFG
ncbi:unnamed protein product [Didymodactylos carnosus]|uniref:VWFA domain-containing protein n=1 Tax=Didymodactylos carnosus TaxID=1234261 RepID=A0A8S2KPD2_9BILA|nr:unnamed protein product [Didymodactylos carnosus]CAF3853236.1 unnamed protein product [Didymodactylos carnosus]